MALLAGSLVKINKGGEKSSWRKKLFFEYQPKCNDSVG